jgi:Zn-dependent peptidase ImmA (M78 family)
MSGPIPVNPELLRWARVSVGMSLEDVAHRFKKDVEEIEAWEQPGGASPTYAQLEKLAYEIYKRPLALFFFPEPPQEESIEQSFRTLPEYELQRIPPRIRILRRKAKVLQLNLAELYEGVNPAQSNISRDLSFSPEVAASKMAEEVRAYLGIGLAEQQTWKQAEDAFKHWRDVLEEHGIYVFKDTFNPPGKKRAPRIDSPFSGFCLYDDHFPLIYVNNNNADTRQIFTLFHELAHLLMHTGGVDTRQDDYIEYLSGDDKRIEVLCNRFASEFLVPASDFDQRVQGLAIDEPAISTLAGLYCVSREVILRRLLDQDRVSKSYYDEKVKQWFAERVKNGGTGGSHYLNKGAYLGERYIELVFSHYHQNRITLEQAAEYLGETAKNMPGMEDWLFKRGAAS